MALFEHARKATVPVLVLAALALPAPAGAKLLLASYNEGLEPHVVLQGNSTPLTDPAEIRLEISAPVQTHAAVHGRFTLRFKSGRSTTTRSYSVAGEAPASRTVTVPRRWSWAKVIRGTARYDDPFVEGWIQIRAFGTSG